MDNKRAKNVVPLQSEFGMFFRGQNIIRNILQENNDGKIEHKIEEIYTALH